MNKWKINWQAVFALIIYPIFIGYASYSYLSYYGFHYMELLMIFLGYYVCNITVGIGLHRLWSHESYKINKFVELILIFLSAGTLQGPAIVWASNHFDHHTYTDTEKDPHSPLHFSNKFFGFLWSHIGWMLFEKKDNKAPIVSKVAMQKLGKNKLLMWQLKYYWQLALLMNTLVPFAFGYFLFGDFRSGLMSFLFIGLGRAIQQQSTFCVNSLCHYAGKINYINGTARDIWWFAPFLLGENWHNYHHAFPKDYRNGVKWYHLDIHKWIIYLMSLLGLAWDLDRTSELRINAKIDDLAKSKQLNPKTHWRLIQDKSQELSNLISLRLVDPEYFKIVSSLDKKIEEISLSLKFISNQAKRLLNLPPEFSSAALIKSSQKQIKLIESELELLFKNNSTETI